MRLLIRLNLVLFFLAGASGAQNISGVYTSAGMGQSVCASWKAYLQGSMGDSVTSPLWITDGDGTFNDPHALNAVYTPGSSDILSRSVILSLTASRINSGAVVSDDMTLTITPSVPARPDVITGAPLIACPPLSGISLKINHDPAATNYVWSSLHPGVSFIPPSTADTQSVDLSPITTPEYVIYVTAFNLCGASPARAVHIKRVLKVSSVEGDVISCANSSKTYSCKRVEGAVSYKWKSTAGISFNGQTGPVITNDTSVNVSFSSNFKTGTISVAAMTPCLTGPFKTITVSDSLLVLGTVIGNTSVCPPGSQMYSILPVHGAEGYSWTLPSNTSGNSATNSVSVSFDSSFTGSGNLCVTATSICGITSVPACKEITKGPPVMPGIISGPAAGICSQTVNYSIETTPGISYNWQVPAGASIIGQRHGSSITVDIPSNMNTGRIRVSAVNNCGISPQQNLVVKGSPAKPPKIVSDIYPVYALSESVRFSSNIITTAAGCSYAWSYPSSATYISGQGTNNLVLNWGEESGSVILTATNSCGSSSNMYFVNINAKRETGNTNLQTDKPESVQAPDKTSSSFNLQAYPDAES